jgi:succinyl-diaminopimelate desuccinylase
MNESWKRIAARIETYRDWAIEVEEKLTAVPAIAPDSGGRGELAKAKVVEELLRSVGISEIQHFDAPDERAEGGVRPNIIARIAAREPGRGRLWIMSHLDVVSEGDLTKWSSDPWKVRVDGDKLFGRGVEDNQQGIVSSLLFARALVEEKIPPEREVNLLLVADEEVGSTYGIQYLLQQNPTGLFTNDNFIVVPDGGRPDGSQIEVAEKSIVWFKVSVTGKSTHASTPERGVNAHRAAANLVVALESLHERFGDKDPVFDPPISTFEPTKREPNVASVNIIPGEDVFYLDCRVLPRYSLAEVEAEVAARCETIEERFGVTITRETPQREEAAPPTSTDAPVVKALQRAVKDVYGVNAEPQGIGGGTVAAYIRHAGYPAVVWARMDETMHTANEYVLLSNIIGDAKVFAHLALI